MNDRPLAASGSSDPTGEEVFVALYPGLRRFARVVCPPESDPDDLVQEALTRTLARGPLEHLTDPAAYLRTAIYRQAANERRRLGRRRRALTRLAGHAAPEDAAAPAPAGLGGLDDLAPRDRAVLYLHIVEGRPHSEVAELVGDSETAVRSRYSRALRRLRANYAESPDEVEEDRDADDR